MSWAFWIFMTAVVCCFTSITLVLLLIRNSEERSDF